MKRFILTGAAAAVLLTACGQGQSTGMTQPIAATTAQVQTVQETVSSTSAGGTESGDRTGEETVTAAETTAGTAAAPSETAQTSYPTASGDPQQDQDTYCRVKAEQDAIEIEISNLEAAYRRARERR